MFAGTDAHQEDHSAFQSDNSIEAATLLLAPTAEMPATAADIILTGESGIAPVQPDLAATAGAHVQTQAAAPAAARSRHWGPVQNPFPAAGQAKVPVCSDSNLHPPQPASQAQSPLDAPSPAYSVLDAAKLQQSAAEQTSLAHFSAVAAAAVNRQGNNSAETQLTAAPTSGTSHPAPRVSTSHATEASAVSPLEHTAVQPHVCQAARSAVSTVHQLAGGIDITPSAAVSNDMEHHEASGAGIARQAVSRPSAAASSLEASRPAAGSLKPRREWGRIVHPFAAAGVAPHPLLPIGTTSSSPG